VIKIEKKEKSMVASYERSVSVCKMTGNATFLNNIERRAFSLRQ